MKSRIADVEVVFSTEVTRRAECNEVRLRVVLLVPVEVVNVERLDIAATATATWAAIPPGIAIAPEERSAL
nr:hypothetical protein [Halopenitus malekzadehii]